MDDPNMHAYGGEGPDDAEIGRRWRENSSLEKWFPLTAERLVALEAENAALKREAYTWWKLATEAPQSERKQCAALCKAQADRWGDDRARYAALECAKAIDAQAPT